ncbi:TIR domain-containing protein [Candidatus Bipolaricaulota bacterium]|nr:TIR domain-containing protein [Candidatus Bipolaricaulota bacterium]
MPDQPEFDYDVFISYSSHDRQWVRGDLLKRIEEAGLHAFVDFRDFKRGAPSIKEMERGVTMCRKTLLILTPAYIESEWCEIEAIMLATLSPANRDLRLIPLLKVPCSKPLRISMLTHIDFTDSADLDLAWFQLLSALEAPLDSERLNSNFETCWPDLERHLAPIVADEAADGNETEAEPGVESSSRGKLSEEYLSVLRVIVEAQDDRVFPSQLADRLGIHQERAKYYMEELERMGILHAAHNYVYGTSWYLSREGRSALVRIGLL